MTDTIVHLQTVRGDMTPYYMARLADDLYEMAAPFVGSNNLPFARIFVFCNSIEIGLKAHLLNNNNTLERVSANKHNIGHNLELLADEAGPLLSKKFSSAERSAIAKANRFFSGQKALQYLSGNLIAEMMTGRKNFPDENDLQNAVELVIKDLRADRHFIGSETTS